MTKASNALFLLSQLKHNKGFRAPDIALGETSLNLDETERVHLQSSEEAPGVSYVDGKGGFKKVYGLPDGRAIAVPNIDTLHFAKPNQAEQLASSWDKGIHEEKAIADKVRNVGLEAQRIEIRPLKVGEFEIPVMVMPRFAKLAEQGLQVRDSKNRESSVGHSMLFGTPANIENPKRLELAMKGLMDDAVVAIKHGFISDGIHSTLLSKILQPLLSMIEIL